MWQSFLGRIKIEWLLFQPTTMVRWVPFQKMEKNNKAQVGL
jgi:hypothetical protein